MTTSNYPQIDMSTWQSRQSIEHPQAMFKRLLEAGVPLDEDIAALVSICDGQVSALVTTPSGLVYRFENPYFDESWWSFAARNYYIVTANLFDRQLLAHRCRIDMSEINGKVWSRKGESAASNMGLDDLIVQVIGYEPLVPVIVLNESAKAAFLAPEQQLLF